MCCGSSSGTIMCCDSLSSTHDLVLLCVVVLVFFCFIFIDSLLPTCQPVTWDSKVFKMTVFKNDSF